MGSSSSLVSTTWDTSQLVWVASCSGTWPEGLFRVDVQAAVARTP